MDIYSSLSLLLNSRSVILNTLPISPAKHYSYCHALRLPVGYLFGADKDLRKMSGDTGRRMVHIILMLNDRSTLSLVMDWGGRNMTMSIMRPIYYSTLSNPTFYGSNENDNHS